MNKVLRSFEEFEKRKKEIEEYLVFNGVLHTEVGHVMEGCKSIAAERFGECPVGGFISAVLGEDFKTAIFTADRINKCYLKQYLLFREYWLPHGLEEGL